MLKKPDPWQAGIKMVTKFFGFDVQDEQLPNKNIKTTTSILGIKQAIQSSLFGQSQPKNYQLKQKWRKLMKFPAKIKYQQIIQLLYQGSAMQEQTWIWMMRNSQKISPQLYSSKKQQFNRIIFSHNRILLNEKGSQKTIQIQDFEQNVQLANMNNLNLCQKKRKFSMTKNNTFIKNQHTNNGRLSLNSQTSTFSSQTHQSNEKIQNYTERDTYVDKNILYGQNYKSQSNRNMMKSSYMSVNSSPVQFQYSQEQFNHVNLIVDQNQSFQSQLTMLPQKITHPVLTSIIGAFLLHREDFFYSITLFNMTATFYYYTNSNEMKTFTLLNHVACSQFYVQYLTKNWQQSGKMITFIANKIREKCPASAYLRNFKLQNFVQNWLFGFFYSVCENGNEVKQKIIGYLLINSFSLDSLVRVCESLIFSLNKKIIQGHEQKIYQCLQNPKYYIDKDVLFYHLLLADK